MIFSSKKKAPKKKYQLGLVLSGGGARGFAHPGAIKAIENFGKKPEVIIGTSAGALAGVFYADGYTPEEIVDLFVGKEFKEFAEIQIPKLGLFKTQGLRNFLKKYLHAEQFEDLAIPLKVVTTNLDEGQSVIFDKGPLIDPIVASCSIPVIFEPVIINGANYVDGGVFKNFPVSVIRSECETIIGVNVSPMISGKENKTLLQIAERTYHYMSRSNTFLDRNLCDTLIEIEDLVSYKVFDLVSATQIFNIGYKQAKKALTK